MNYNNNDIWFLSIAAVFFIVGVSVGIGAADSHIERNIIKNGCGQYNPITSDFEYINRLDSIKEVMGE